MPVQTAYAVPIGNVSTAFINSSMLRLSATKNPVYQKVFSVPVASFDFARQAAKPTSKSPATMRISHAIDNLVHHSLFVSPEPASWQYYRSKLLW